MKKRKDKYERAIEYLTKHPEKIKEAWLERDSHPTEIKRAHALFEICGTYGCLTEIRSRNRFKAQTLQLIKKIRADTRIPITPNEIKVSDLPVFAEWQRRLDKELKRK